MAKSNSKTKKSNNPDHKDNLTPFSKENQPSPEAKSEGWAKKRMFERLAETLIKGEALELLQMYAEEMGIEIEDIDLETAMWLRQAHKAFVNGDTKAYNAAMDRLRGKPIQETKETGTPVVIHPPVWGTVDAKRKKKKK